MTARTVLRVLFSIGLVVLLLASACCGQELPSTRDLVLLEFRKAENAEMEGNLWRAVVEYSGVFNFEDKDEEFPDVRAKAGVGLGRVYARLKYKQDAEAALRKVLHMPDAPTSTKAAAELELQRLELANNGSGLGTRLVIVATLVSIVVLIVFCRRRSKVRATSFGEDRK